jgi:hypothetical protein
VRARFLLCRRVWPVILLACLVAGLLTATAARAGSAPPPGSLDDETMLSLILPPQANGSRPGVHLWARADQANGPGGLPTVFVVTLYTRQGANGPEEREIVNYLQYSNGAWNAARPRDNGALLIQDWAWVSLNLTNLTAQASGQGNSSQYTVDYTSSGPYQGSQRNLSLEEVYATDLSLTSSVVLADTANATGSPSSPATATPANGSTPSAPSATPAPSLSNGTPTATPRAGTAALPSTNSSATPTP